MPGTEEDNGWSKLDAGVIFNCRVRKGEVMITDDNLYNPDRIEEETRVRIGRNVLSF